MIEVFYLWSVDWWCVCVISWGPWSVSSEWLRTESRLACHGNARKM